MRKLIYLICILLLVSSVNAFSLTGFVTGLFEHDVATAISPKITNYYADPVKVMVGQELRIVISFEDEYGIDSAMVTFPYEGGYDSVPMELIDGTAKKGTYVGTWTAHDTKNRKWYYSEVLLVNIIGKSSSIKVAWEDPTVSHSAAQITPGDFQTGDYHFPNGNVGVGTNGPAAKLEVESGSFDQMKLERTGGAGAGVSMEWENSDDETAKIELTGGQRFDFEIPSGTPVMSIESDGDVGIGTANPAAKLHVNDSGEASSFEGLRVEGAIHDAGLGVDHQGSNWGSAIYQDGSKAFVVDSNKGIIVGDGYFDGAAPADGAIIEGNVGIGTQTPGEELYVEGDINASGDICITGGNCLSSGGLGGAGVANRAAFWTDASTMSYDNNFTWDNTNKRLGLGETSPTARLDIQGEDGTSGTAPAALNVTGGAGNDSGHGGDIILKGGAGGSQIMGNGGIGGGIYLQPGFGGSTSNVAGSVVLAENGGYVGIGYNPTTKVGITPAYKFMVAGDSHFNNSVDILGDVGITGNAEINSTFYVDDGKVGIGTNTPSTALEINSNNTINMGPMYISANTGSNEIVHFGTYTWYDGASWHFPEGKPGSLMQMDDNTTAFWRHNGSDFYQTMALTDDGDIGIGESTPGAKLHVRYPGATTPSGPSGTWAARIDMNQDSAGYNGLSVASRWGSNTGTIFEAGSYWTGAAESYTPVLSVKGDRKVGIGTTDPSHELNVVGDANVTGNIHYGGNLSAYGADFAEMMTQDESLETGDVVCMNENMNIIKCTSHGQNAVAGVVSEKPTIMGNSNAPNSVPVGIVGIVTTKVKGPIEQFDLLTTSQTPGHAEKATIDDFGAIVGKAMQPCEKETCQIKVLVGLR